jgi:hypothetical protein
VLRNNELKKYISNKCLVYGLKDNEGCTESENIF